MYKSFIVAFLLLVSCADQSSTPSVDSPRVDESFNLPVGLSVLDKSADGLYIRLSSSTRVSDSELRETVDAISDCFDRIDFCLDGSSALGDEYASVIASQVFDYENDSIYSLYRFYYGEKVKE